ncbi:hypothetical protein [Kitasatospora sp. NPDC098663]|uniref:hypothetical protein n=1 Tax=Kitasatospora sp. NPDC098663 TaxID=3364096 RepID=UPI00380386B2
MGTESQTLFQTLVHQRGMAEYRVFLRRLEAAGEELAQIERNPALAKVTIGDRQFSRWMEGVREGERLSKPRPLTARVLEHLFQRRIDDLFAVITPAGTTHRIGGGGSEGQWMEPSTGSDAHHQDMLMTAANESARFASYAEQSNVGPHTLEQLDADIRRIVITYPNRPVVPLFNEVRALRDRTFELLEGRQPPAYTRDLYLAAGVLCGILANASFDLGDYRSAATQARTAFLCGEQAAHNGLRSWIRGTQAMVAYWDDRLRDAVHLARDGQQYMPERGTAHIRLASIAARAYARLGREREALDALRTAEEYRQQGESGEDLPGGMMAFPPAKQALYSSTTHLWLGGASHLEQAAADAEESVALYQSEPVERQRLGELSLARMDLALAELGSGEVEGAADQVEAVLALASRRPTEAVNRRLDQFARQLAAVPAGSSPLGLTMQDAIAHHRRNARQLPSGGHR